MFEVDFLTPMDIFSLDLVNYDYNTENYQFEYYLYYLLHHEEDMLSIFKSDGHNKDFQIHNKDIIAYFIGKQEAFEKLSLKAHVSSISVSYDYRRFLFGKYLMELFEKRSESIGSYFVDLYVRASSTAAINFYRKLGYVVYRRVINYYNEPQEDANDMRKSLGGEANKMYVQGGKDIDQSEIK